MFMQSFLRRLALTVGIVCAGLPAYAATEMVSVYIDRDNQAATGCTVSLPGGPFNGVELQLRTTIQTDSIGAEVDQVEVLTCNGVALGSPVIVDSGDWPIAIGTGDSASALVDTYLPLSFLSGARIVRVAIATSGDSMTTAPGGGPILIVIAAADVPLSPGALVLLTILLSIVAVTVLTRRAGHPFLPLFLVAFVLIAALPPATWTGQLLRAADPKGDAPANADLVSFYAQVTGGNLLARIHADVRPDTGGNLAPQVNAGANQTITLPDNAAALAGVVSDDGLPAPAALTQQWALISGPAGVYLATPTATATDAGFAMAGTYVLRLTASDGALSTFDDVTVTVIAETNGAPLLAALVDRTMAVGETLTIQVAADDPNPGDTLTYSLTASPAGAALSPAGSPSFSFTPTPQQLGPQLVTVRVQDPAGANDSEDFLITVVNGNEPPVLASQTSERIPIGAAFARTLSATDPDLPADTLTFAMLDGPAGMSVVGNQLQWTPAAGDRGEHPVTVAVTDLAGAADQERFVLTAAPFAAPVANDDAYEIVLGQTLNVAAPGVSGNDVDPEGGTLTATKTSDPDKGSVTSFNANGSFTYQAPPSVAPPPPLNVQSKWLGLQSGSIIYGHSPLVGDLDGDDKSDVVFVSGNRSTHAVRHDGTTLFSFDGTLPAPNNDCAADGSQMALGDINDDGDVEIVLSVNCASRDQIAPPYASSPNRVAALSYNTTTQAVVVDWISPPASLPVKRPDPDPTFYAPGNYTEHATFTIARLAPAEKPSVLWSRTYGANECGQIIAGKTDRNCRIVTVHDGATGAFARQLYHAPADQGQLSWGTNYDGYIGQAAPIVANLDTDAELEILTEGTVFNLDGTVLREYDGDSTKQPSRVMDSMAVDLDGDGSPEVLTNFTYGTQGALMPLRAYRNDGSLLWSLLVPTTTVQSRMTAADLDRDGRPEIIFSLYNTIYVLTADGHYKWARTIDHSGVQYMHSGGGDSSRFPAYDLNGDGIIELIVQDGRNDVLFLRGDNGATQTTWHYTDPASGGSQAQMAPIVADLDGDGETEVVLVRDVNANNQHAVVALEGINPWRAAPMWFNQFAFTGSNIEVTGHIPSTPPAFWTDPATNVFAQQQVLPYVLDPRLRTQTTFQYKSRNAMLDSSPATVTIDILPKNRPPVVTSTPPSSATNPPPGAINYQISATDPDLLDTIAYQMTYRGCGNSSNVTVSSTGLFTYSAGSPGAGNVQCLFIVELSDGNGGLTPHSFTIFFTNESRTVPVLTGLDRGDVAVTLAAVDLVPGVVTEVANAAPAGEVIGQSPASSSSVLRGSTVDYTVSTGPLPRVVPNVVGRLLLTADSLLVAGGFTSGATTFVYDPLMPRNEVISQSPGAGTEIIPTAVALIVSAGSGLELRLDRTVTTSDVPIAFSAVSFTLAGTEGPAPALNYVVTPAITPFAGSLPAIAGSNITFGSATRGGFRLTATDPVTSRQAFADFAVAQPRLPGTSSQMEQFAQLTEALTEMQELMQQAKAAVDANDTATATSLVRDFVLRWRAVDGVSLRQAAPFSPETGFPPQIGDLPGTVVPGPDDAINQQLIREAAEALAAWSAGLRTDGTTLAELQTLGDAFIEKARLLRGLTPGEYGTVLAAPEYAAIASHGIPDLMDAMTDELAVIVGLPALAPGSSSLRIATHSTLSELAVTQAVNVILDQVNEAQQYVKQVLHQAFYGMAVVAVTQHVKSFVQGKQIEAVISGASMSFRLFESPYSMIEGKALERKYPQLNTVLLIGPQLFDAVTGLVEKMKKASKLNVDPDDQSDGQPRWKNLDEVFNDFKAMIDAGQAVNQAFANAQQETRLADRPCIFTSDPTCVQLMYPDGFKSVYEYAPPPGLSSLTGLPLPIVFVVKNNVNGQVLFDTPIFYPTVP